MDPPSSIEVDYIKNLQKQVYLLELETSFLEQAKKVTSIQPKITIQAGKLLQKMKELHLEMNNAQLKLGRKESHTEVLEAENQAIHRRLQTLSDANNREKLLLMKDVTKLKKLSDISVEDIAQKKDDLERVQQELQKTMNSVKEREHHAQLLENELHQKIQQHEDMEAKLAESRSECVRLQALLHQLEENHLSSSQSGQQHIAKELCEEAQKLRELLKEKEISADENKYLCNKVAENCGHLTKENGFLQSQVLEASKHLDRERQLREEESTCNSRRISELVSRKEKERQLELKLTYLKGLLQDERKKVLPIREQVLGLQQGRKSVDLNEQSFQSQLTDLERRYLQVQLENSSLQREKTHLVQHISQLHKQISEKDDEIRRMHRHANTMVQDLNSLKSQVDTEHTLQKESWKQLANILTV